MTDQTVYVEGEIFLGRTNEQEQFREILQTVRTSKNVEDSPPFIILIHGDGGMGKSQLVRRLRDIAQYEVPFEGDFYTIRFDWELIRHRTPALRVAREQIQPEEVLAAFHRAFLEKGWNNQFSAYQKVIKQRQKAAQQCQSSGIGKQGFYWNCLGL